METLAVLYLWLKAAHLIFVIFWIAGLFMLPRLFVYHQEAPEGSQEAANYIARERKLLKIILNPSLVLVWVLGIALMVTIQAWTMGWFHVKLLLVLALSGYHGYLASYAGKLARGERPLTGPKLRLVNEVPAIAVAIIVVLVIVKPF
ncbi:CopD family protein [Novosphingopyxis sp.]|uniref:CopD family protein n=1 Tax=Novosphingopyxis sp. TaxID=2709690 RepID=UPI003B5ABBDE